MARLGMLHFGAHCTRRVPRGKGAAGAEHRRRLPFRASDARWMDGWPLNSLRLRVCSDFPSPAPNQCNILSLFSAQRPRTPDLCNPLILEHQLHSLSGSLQFFAPIARRRNLSLCANDKCNLLNSVMFAK